MRVLHLIHFLCLLMIVHDVTAQIPTLPEGAHSEWIIEEPKEIVTWILFDPVSVSDKLPSALRFITVEELAANEIDWASEYIKDHPSKNDWGISFLEIARMKTFTIDGKTPVWPKNGAIGLWFARVAPAEPTTDLGIGQPFLALEFWLPDSTYVNSIRKKGHYATYGNVVLSKDDEETWQGHIKLDDLNIYTKCLPMEVKRGGENSSGMQTIFPPQSSGINSVVQIAFAGHQIAECKNGGLWNLNGSHPLTMGVLLNPSEFQFGYELIGGAYSW